MGSDEYAWTWGLYLDARCDLDDVRGRAIPGRSPEAIGAGCLGVPSRRGGVEQPAVIGVEGQCPASTRVRAKPKRFSWSLRWPSAALATASASRRRTAAT